MKRDLTIRCVSTGTVRTDSPDGARYELRDIWLELDGTRAHVQIMETCDRGQRTRDSTVDFGHISVRSRAGHDVYPLASPRRMPLDWLLATAESLREGERRTVALWVPSMDLAALLRATPVALGEFRALVHQADEAEGTAPTLLSPSPRLRLIAATQ